MLVSIKLIFALFRMPYNLLTLLPIPILYKHWRFYFNLYYLYCLSIFQRTSCFRFKSGCKGKRFYFNYQMFSEVFFRFSFSIVSQALLAKGKEGTNKKKLFKPFLCELDDKDKNFITLLPKLLRSFFVLYLSRITLLQHVKQLR